ncbi:MAG: rhodanese-like domain-containing protein [Gammaproteobacteria bacterium]|nr:rhodanese-like domain-containing protein [Gammaproteobacteria bacterium]
MIRHIAGYRFVPLVDLMDLRATMQAQAKQLELKGTILLSTEGINIQLAGEPLAIETWLDWLNVDTRFSDMSFRMSETEQLPFVRLKVKIKKEIITMRQPSANPIMRQAPSISPELFHQWLEEKRDITVLDTRNDFEYQFGAFEGAENLHLKEFSEFPEAMLKVSRNRPIVMYCTGGVRCEKAALAMMDAGYSEVYQLEGGILNYFAQVGGAHYHGDCFVFDERIALNSDLKPI